ncbi:MAG: ArsC family transcriptional regulator [Spirochaetaceae bacterium 4572_59]|nr:MAG: ArsC family transcriptional regulator [Spirochaetaceae bacterium 4572_59]
MNIQIIGTKKCRETRKAERFFKERGIKFQTLDLKEKGLAKGELRSILSKVSLDDLINTEAPLYKKKFAYMDFDAEEELLEHPELLRTPIVRSEGRVSIGNVPALWKSWLEN